MSELEKILDDLFRWGQRYKEGASPTEDDMTVARARLAIQALMTEEIKKATTPSLTSNPQAKTVTNKEEL